MFLRIATCYTCMNLYTLSATATYNVVNGSAQPMNPWIVLQMLPTYTSYLEWLVSLHKPWTWSHIFRKGSYGGFLTHKKEVKAVRTLELCLG